jgi:hypothetical protein
MIATPTRELEICSTSLSAHSILSLRVRDRDMAPILLWRYEVKTHAHEAP